MLTQYSNLEEILYQKQLQINCILDITKVINNNAPADELYHKFKTFLTKEMYVSKMLFLLWDEGEWKCSSSHGIENPVYFIKNPQIFIDYKHISKLNDEMVTKLKGISFIIPIRHKEEPIAFILIGFKDQNVDEYNRIKFITTISNIIAVAIENKRLFKRQVDQEKLKKEMEVASQVQQMLIPTKLPENKSYSVSTIYHPHTTVGGDFISCVESRKGQLSICIADVSGKGVPAALLMANFQAMYQSATSYFKDPKKIIKNLNQHVFNITKGEKFITCFLGIYDYEKSTLTYINAGHNPPILFQNGKSALLKKGTTILGAFEDIPFLEIGEVNVEKDALLLCYTDGLVELQNNDGEYYQEKRLLDFVARNKDCKDCDINNKLLEEIDLFKQSSDFQDDIAVLTIRFKKSKNGVIKKKSNER